METAIASLEEQLAAASREREEALSRNENLASELEAKSERFSKSSTELNILREEVSGLVSFLLLFLSVLTGFTKFIVLPARLEICLLAPGPAAGGGCGWQGCCGWDRGSCGGFYSKSPPANVVGGSCLPIISGSRYISLEVGVEPSSRL